MPEVLKNNATLNEAIDICLYRNFHFAAYRLPGEHRTSMIIQKDPEIHNLLKLDDRLPERGFLIAPFSKENNEIWLIKPDILLHDAISESQLKELNSVKGPSPDIQNSYTGDTSKDDYIRLINESVENILAGAFEKVVLSRVKSVPGKFKPKLHDIFQALCSSYPDAFVYLFCVKGQCWAGATPEPFICSRNNEIQTVSLAGTRTYSSGSMDIADWNRKELEEQDYVTRHIQRIFHTYHISEFEKEGPYVARAGNLLHLRTNFRFPVRNIGNKLPSLIASLHPTPAVCGMSTGKAMDFIKSSEKHDREYYAGFLGPVGISDPICLYVNLRCMKVYNDRLVLYIGGGITHDSVAEEEWEETEIKAETLLSVIKQIR
jgi:isochorismate synthase